MKDASAPAPADEDLAALDARVRMKLANGEKLSAEEERFFARLPGDKEITPEALRERRDAQ